jgi:hypothetical protein
MPYRFRNSSNNNENNLCITVLFFSCPERYFDRFPCTYFVSSLLLLLNSNNNTNTINNNKRASANVTG